MTEEWGSIYTNSRGKTLIEDIASLDVALLNSGPEYTFSRVGAVSVLVLIFCSSATCEVIICDIPGNRPAAAAPTHKANHESPVEYPKDLYLEHCFGMLCTRLALPVRI